MSVSPASIQHSAELKKDGLPLRCAMQVSTTRSKLMRAQPMASSWTIYRSPTQLRLVGTGCA